MNRKQALILIIVGIVMLVVVILIALPGIINPKHQSEISDFADESIKIGLIYDLSGPGKRVGEKFLNGFLLAAEDINSTGGIGGKKIDLVAEDSQFDPKRGLSAFNKLTEIDGATVISSFGSAVSLALKEPVMNKNILIFADASHPEITSGSKTILRHANTTRNDAKVVAEFITQFNSNKIGVLYLNDDWGASFNSEFRSEVEKNMGESEIYSDSFDKMQKDFRAQIGKLIGSDVDLIVISAIGGQASLVMKQIKESGFAGIITANVGLILTLPAEDFSKDWGSFYYQDFTTTPDEYIERYEARFGKKPGMFAVVPYTDAEILRHAMETVGDDNLRIADYVKSLKSFSGRYENVQINESGDIIIGTVMRKFEAGE